MEKFKSFMTQFIMAGAMIIVAIVVCTGVAATFYWAVSLKVENDVSLTGRCQCYLAPGCAVRSHEFVQLQREYPTCLSAND